MTIKRVWIYSLWSKMKTASLIAQGFTVIPIQRSLSDGVATNNPTISDYGNDKNKWTNKDLLPSIPMNYPITNEMEMTLKRAEPSSTDLIICYNKHVQWLSLSVTVTAVRIDKERSEWVVQVPWEREGGREMKESVVILRGKREIETWTLETKSA